MQVSGNSPDVGHARYFDLNTSDTRGHRVSSPSGTACSTGVVSASLRQLAGVTPYSVGSHVSTSSIGNTGPRADLAGGFWLRLQAGEGSNSSLRYGKAVAESLGERARLAP